jgi:predicted metalloprotease with PDZ domain
MLGRAVAADPLTIFADASKTQKSGVAVTLTVPVKSRELTLVYPRWLPGSHSAEGALQNVARLKIVGNGSLLPWRRDPYDPYIIRATVPKNVRQVEVTYDYVPPQRSGSEVFYGVASSKNIAVINPAAFALAPQGDPQEIPVSFRLRLPAGWSAASALATKPTADAATPDTLSFAPVSLYTLIDSPIMAGTFRKSLALPTVAGDVPHTLEIFAESEDGLKKEASVAPLFQRMVAESRAMFGTRHYPSFHFLLALSDEIPPNGLEHHASVAYVLSPTDLDRAGKQVKTSPTEKWRANLVPHEFVHSWNGKFRRPYGEAVKSNTAPQSADLVWVYEGLTEYLGEVLMVRSGFLTPEEWRLSLAREAVDLRSGAGRDWQSLADAALSMPHTYVHGNGTSLRPVNDVYMGGRFVWLEADAIIRQESGGKRSLDDFCRLFFGGPNNGAEIKPYVKADIVKALQSVQPYDWAIFIESRFYAALRPGQLDQADVTGWKLAFSDAPKELVPLAEGDLRFSLGFNVSTAGIIYAIQTGSLAERAGIKDNTTILGVNGLRFTRAKLREAIRHTAKPDAPKSIELLLADTERYFTVRLDSLSGERFPVWSRAETKADQLSRIVAPLAPSASPVVGTVVE